MLAPDADPQPGLAGRQRGLAATARNTVFVGSPARAASATATPIRSLMAAYFWKLWFSGRMTPCCVPGSRSIS